MITGLISSFRFTEGKLLSLLTPYVSFPIRRQEEAGAISFNESVNHIVLPVQRTSQALYCKSGKY